MAEQGTDEGGADPESDRGFLTRAVHGSEDRRSGPVGVPIVASATFRFATIAALAEANAGRGSADEFYTRYGNPTIREVESRLAEIEGAEAALVFSSGMAAITAVALAFLRSGDRLVATRELYGGTLALFQQILVPLGVRVVLVSGSEEGALERACGDGAALVWVETPTNPLCRIVDLARAASAARTAGAPLACDATFASPWNQATLRAGADLSVHSATKYLGGHSDLLAGSVAGSRALIARVERVRRVTGAVPDPEQAWRLGRSLKTLALRVERQNRTAQVLAEFLESSAGIVRVHYPGLASHPDHAVAHRQMRGYGGMLTFEVDGGEPAARRFAEALRLIAIAPSLGGVESLVSPPIHTSHASLTPEERRAAGIADGALRLSVGIEDAGDLVDDLRRGLAASGAA